MKFENILTESRKSEFEKKFGSKFSQDHLAKIFEEIPSKYWQWVGSVLDQISFDQNFEQLKNLISYFDKFGSNLKKSDIYQYKSLDELKTELDQYSNRQRRKYKQSAGANVVFESPKYVVVNPLSPESSCYYGKGTKWCTAATNYMNSFNEYNKDGKLFYILNKTLPTSDPNYKLGYTKKFDGYESFYDAQNNKIPKNDVISNTDIPEILEKISTYFDFEYREQIKKFEEETNKKKEEERLRKLETFRIQRAKEYNAEERRTEQEWALNEGMSEEAKKAWAVLYLLESDGVPVRTSGQQLSLDELNIELEKLNKEYDEMDGFSEELYHKISDLESQRDDLMESIDVYELSPVSYQHYDLDQFEVLKGEAYGRTYAVGTEIEVEYAIKDYVDNLIDDIGITGFNKSFWMNHLNVDSILDNARDNFSQDVNDNPEAYFDDDERTLDKKQIERIKILKQRISILETNIENLEELQSQDDEIDLDEKIEELREQIEEHEQEIEDTENDPQGDFPEGLIEDKVEEMVDDAERDPEQYLDNYGLEASDFVDLDEFRDAVIDEDGYGPLSSYDGTYETFEVMGETFYVFRID